MIIKSSKEQSSPAGEPQGEKSVSDKVAAPPKSQKALARKLSPGKLKQQLHEKSSGRRKRNAAKTSVVAAASRPGRNDLQPVLKSVWKPVGALRPSPTRTRVSTNEQLEKVLGSIKQFGFVLPILIDEHDTIVCGHLLWEAAKQLGFEKIECRIVSHLDPLELEALSIVLNRIAETGTFDLTVLRERMIEIQSGGIELTNLGFTIPEIDQIILDPEPVKEEDEEDGENAPEDDTPPITRLGDLFHLGEHSVLCGDALEEVSYRQVLADRQAQMVFSDPPYNCPVSGFVSGLGKQTHDDFVMACGEMDDVQFMEFLRTYLDHCRAHTSHGAMIYACMDWRQIDLLLLAGRYAGLTRNNMAVWDKGSGGMTGSIYRSRHELIGIYCNGQAPAINNVALGAHGRDRTNVWCYPGANRQGSSSSKALADHPTPKPVELIEDVLLDVTRPGDIVLDPFLGSGSTLIAAERAGRVACGIELEPKYVDRAVRRWEQMTGEEAIHAETGLTLTELAEMRAADHDA